MADLIGYFAALRWAVGNPPISPWQKTWHTLGKLHENQRMCTILEQIGALHDAPPAVALCGQVDPLARHPDDLDMVWTTILCSYLVLRFSSTNSKASRRRFRQTERMPAYAGYSVDDWFAAMLSVAFFLERRNRRKVLNSKSGNVDRTGKVVAWRATDVDLSQFGPESVDDVELERCAREGIELRGAMAKLPALATGQDNLLQMMDRMDSRLLVLLASNYTTSLSRVAAARGIPPSRSFTEFYNNIVRSPPSW